MKNKKELLNKYCLVCNEPLLIYTVYTRQQKFIEMNSVCIPCKEKADRERLQNLPPKQH